MKSIALLSALAILSCVCNAQSQINSTSPYYLLGKWAADPFSSYDNAPNYCYPLGVVDFIPNPTNSSSTYFVAVQFQGSGCSGAGLYNSNPGVKIELGYASNSSELDLQGPFHPNSQGLATDLYAMNDTRLQVLITYDLWVDNVPERYMLLGHFTRITEIEICKPIIIGSDNVFNLCPFNETGLFTVDNYIYNQLSGNVTFGLTSSPAVECEGDTAWAIFTAGFGECVQIANEDPVFTLFNTTEPSQGIQITFPTASPLNPNFYLNYQVTINLLCDVDEVDPSQTAFTMTSSTQSDYLSNVTITGYSAYGCLLQPSANQTLDY